MYVGVIYENKAGHLLRHSNLMWYFTEVKINMALALLCYLELVRFRTKTFCSPQWRADPCTVRAFAFPRHRSYHFVRYRVLKNVSGSYPFAYLNLIRHILRMLLFMFTFLLYMNNKYLINPLAWFLRFSFAKKKLFLAFVSRTQHRFVFL